MKIFPTVWLAVLLILSSCKTQQKTNSVTTNTSPEPQADLLEVEHRNLDTLVITAPKTEEEPQSEPESYQLPVYNPSYTRANDLLHTRLDLRFNWEKEQVLGKATLTFKPFFYPAGTLSLDAKDFEIHKLIMVGSEENLAYEYDGHVLQIELGKTYESEEEYTIYIEYTAKPAETEGSAAITSDQGLFFINPTGEEADKPQQIWTQGETEWNSRWFPTIDKPNERCTQEIYLTVQDKFQTLSNGVLISSEKNDDGTRTDYWKMDQPHAPYLFMIAVGEYAVVRDNWEGIPVDYYVEREYEASARAIFSNTVGMLDFFSNKLGVKYPWPKYSQIVVRDYVSGAMENTTGVIFGEFVQKHKKELIDDHNEKIVAHELFHHWFGDLVTCESWANLTMNEGFANYSEYLWLEYKYGKDEADYHMMEEWNGYLTSSRGDMHPLIHFSYNDKEDMFDAHSYNKGGSVLHMLRNYVGDEAFWSALNVYLTENAYQAVEVHDLRLAFEQVTGQDLNWFFDQWYLDQGHPQLTVNKEFNEEEGLLTISVEQTQDPQSNPAIFQLPLAVDIYMGKDQVRREKIMISERIQTFEFALAVAPQLVVFDADHALLGEIDYTKEETEYAFQFLNAPALYDRLEAMQALQNSDIPEVGELNAAALDDPFWAIRGITINSIDLESDSLLLVKIRKLGVSDPHSYVRALALDKLSEIEDPGSKEIAVNAIEKDSAYHVIATALYLLSTIDQELALSYADKMADQENDQIVEVLQVIFGESGDPKYLSYFEKHMDEFDGYDALPFIAGYQALAAQADLDTAMEAMNRLKAIALNMEESQWRRVASTKGLNDMKNQWQERMDSEEEIAAKAVLEEKVVILKEWIETIKATETDEQIKALYEQMR